MTPTLRLRTEDLEWRDIEGEVVALDLRTATYLTVNKSGAKLWSALASGASREQLSDLLTSEFDIPREQAISDADAFIQMLAGRDMLLEG
jgi:hypothetical protein